MAAFEVLAIDPTTPQIRAPGSADTYSLPRTLAQSVGTQTASVPVFDSAVTWNNAAVTFTGIKFNITDTASNGSSLLMDLQVGGASRFSVRKDGAVTLSATLQTSGTTSFNGWSAFGGNSGEGLAFGSTSGIRWASSTSTGVFTSGDTGISRKAAKIVEINSGTTGTYAGTAFTTGSQTVAQLPAAATAGAGARAFVTDATVTTFASTVVGGGANGVPVVSNGTNWIIG